MCNFLPNHLLRQIVLICMFAMMCTIATKRAFYLLSQYRRQSWSLFSTFISSASFVLVSPSLLFNQSRQPRCLADPGAQQWRGVAVSVCAGHRCDDARCRRLVLRNSLSCLLGGCSENTTMAYRPYSFFHPRTSPRSRRLILR